MAEKALKTLDVEQLITWALRDQGMGWETGAAEGTSWSDLGTRVDTSTRWSVPAPSAALQTDDDALVVRQLIDRLPVEAAALVIQHGRIGGRPDWCEEGEGQMVHKHDGRGRPMWDWDDEVNRSGEKRPRMVFEGTRPELVAFHRAQYAVWHAALAALVPQLNAALQGHQAIGPFAPARPWEAPRGAVLYPAVEGAQLGS
jgi:hypothetical protein